ncbi:hypothetical protein DVA67_032845 [Solirubrobacter sp. CPCC 204708]|uniref:DUF4878 domain-containing protein n=1 Tax=Solirubrobacter deserti TaxID=2282478 RepID=A0ABT4RIR1_9ACTN|nr:hypothetical protein [Solirubrobacter deserti]MBE2320794.1 hypothetical protein [Solirubrobacter deserti]MDA0138429.1 hypothetical protein [Solirubrobacter deserti]
MRWLVLALVPAFGFAGFVVVAAVTSGPAGESDLGERHLPETAEEQLVARVATAHVRKLIRGRSVHAEGDFELNSIAVREDGTASVWFTGLQPGPILSVSLRREGERWRAISHDSFALI